MGAHTLGVRTCKWATYAARRGKLGQHLDGDGEFNCPLSCGLYLEGSVKEKWHRGTTQRAFRISSAILLKLCHIHNRRKVLCLLNKQTVALITDYCVAMDKSWRRTWFHPHKDNLMGCKMLCIHSDSLTCLAKKMNINHHIMKWNSWVTRSLSYIILPTFK